MAKILGHSMTQLGKGQLTSTLNKISNFTPSGERIAFGELLKYGTEHKHLEVFDGSETDMTVLAGIGIKPEAASSFVYPSTQGKTHLEPGQWGDLLVTGDIAIELSADGDVAEAVQGAKVFLGSDGKVTTKADDGASTPVANLEFKQLQFLGTNEVVNGVQLVNVRKLY